MRLPTWTISFFFSILIYLMSFFTALTSEAEG